MTEEARVKRWQARIFAACFLAYTAAYICRVNISVAIPGIQNTFGFSSANMGIVGASFFWAYAIGQLVNGYLGDKVSSRMFIFAGLVFSALINIAFGFCAALFAMIFLWGANGIFQSMLWGPIVKTLSYWFPGKKHGRIAFGMSITTIFGYLIAWGLSGAIMNRFNWRWVFWLTAILVIVLAFIWYFVVRNKPSDEGLPPLNETHENVMELSSSDKDEYILPKTPFWKMVVRTNLIFVALTGIAQGIIKDSITLWSPKLLIDTQHLSFESTIMVILIIPVINFLGVLLAGWINRVLKSQEKLTIIILMIGSTVTSFGLVLLIHVNIIATILLLACSSACMFGANPLMTTVIPLNYAFCNRVSSAAGFIDFSIYLGSGLAGVITGLIVDIYGWDAVFLIWCAASTAGALFMYIGMLKDRKNKLKETIGSQIMT